MNLSIPINLVPLRSYSKYFDKMHSALTYVRYDNYDMGIFQRGRWDRLTFMDYRVWETLQLDTPNPRINKE